MEKMVVVKPCLVLGKEVIAFFDKIEPCAGNYCVWENEKCGILTTNGTVLLEVKWERIVQKDDCFLVRKNHKWGAISFDGKTILETEWNRIDYFDDYIGAYRDGKFYTFSKDGQLRSSH